MSGTLKGDIMSQEKRGMGRKVFRQRGMEQRWIQVLTGNGGRQGKERLRSPSWGATTGAGGLGVCQFSLGLCAFHTLCTLVVSVIRHVQRDSKCTLHPIYILLSMLPPPVLVLCPSSRASPAS